jgi:hypothetical protein
MDLMREWGVESIEISGWMYLKACGLAWLVHRSVDKAVQSRPGLSDSSMREHRKGTWVCALTTLGSIGPLIDLLEHQF